MTNFDKSKSVPPLVAGALAKLLDKQADVSAMEVVALLEHELCETAVRRELNLLLAQGRLKKTTFSQRGYRMARGAPPQAQVPMTARVRGAANAMEYCVRYLSQGE